MQSKDNSVIKIPKLKPVRIKNLLKIPISVLY